MAYLGLPNVHTNAILCNPAKTTLFVGTYGRGTWKAALATTPQPFSISGKVTNTSGTGLSGITVKLNKKRSTNIVVNTSPNATIPDWDANGLQRQHRALRA
jgi:hypothetical protein